MDLLAIWIWNVRRAPIDGLSVSSGYAMHERSSCVLKLYEPHTPR